jgi:hypothetical protein
MRSTDSDPFESFSVRLRTPYTAAGAILLFWTRSLIPGDRKKWRFRMTFFNSGERLSNFLHALAAIPFGLAALTVASHLIARLV